MRAAILGILTMTMLLACNEEPTLFRQIDPVQSGIYFANRISENDTFNILSFEYVYNGGGVGVGDFDNDGLQDVFFSGNMVPNRLYKNLGDFKFQDITDAAGVAAENRWCSGVAVVDINNDGWLDIYVCATTYSPESRRKNLLFVNQGTTPPTFREQAEDYGLADGSHTTTAAFFDYDNDGDLDCYLVVNQMDENAIPNRYRNKITDGSSHRTDKLLRNDFDEEKGHAVFTDVSASMGISVEGFGLAVAIVDFNGDGWKDIYVSNDYLTNDLLWINQGVDEKGAHKGFNDKAAEWLKHTCYSAMGNEVADLNNDGLPDIVAVDMLPEDNLRRKTMLPPNNYTTYLNNDRFGYQYQFIRNVLQLNQGTRPDTGEPLFSDVAMQAGISSTDWSWSPLAADYDLDGDRDLIITNGFPHDVTDRDFMDFNADKGQFLTHNELLHRIPSVKIPNYAFRNTLGTAAGIPVFEKVSKEWGLGQASFSNGAAYADLDNDGDLDFIVNNIDDSAFVFHNMRLENTAHPANWLNVKLQGPENNRNGLGAQLTLFAKGKKWTWENSPYRGYLSSVEAGAHFGLDTLRPDSLLVLWPSVNVDALPSVQVIRNVPVNQTLAVKYSEATKETATIATQEKAKPLLLTITTEVLEEPFIHQESDYIDYNVQRLLWHKLSQYGPGLAVADINDDGLEDFYISGSHFHKGSFFMQFPDGRFATRDLLPGPDGDAKRQEELGALFFDADGDGDPDLYLVSGGYEFDISDTCYQDRLFFNEGGQFVERKSALPALLSSGSCVRAADYDQDGDLDLFVGGRVLPNMYPKPVSSQLLRNDGKGNFVLVNADAAPALDSLGLVCDALWTDYDNDGWTDLLVAGEWMPLTFFRNENGHLTKANNTGLASQTGWWNSLTALDFDLDGDMDYVAGNFGTNTLLKASDEQPVAVYAADFDANNTDDENPLVNLQRVKSYDALPAAWFPDEKGVKQEFPFFGRNDMEKQLIKVKRLWLHHSDYARVTMLEIIKQFPTVKPLVVKASWLQSSIIENLGNGQFRLHALPPEAQVAPVYGIIARDFNGDGLPDLLLTGNDYGIEVGMGRCDAANGCLLLNKGGNNWQPLPMAESGFCVPGDAKSLVSLDGPNGREIILSAENRGPLRFFTSDKPAHVIPLRPLDCAAVVSLSDGRTYRVEMPYGQGFLSQSARSLRVPYDATVEIFEFSGTRRRVQPAQ